MPVKNKFDIMPIAVTFIDFLNPYASVNRPPIINVIGKTKMDADNRSDPI